jgi:dTMP kinase
MADSIATVIVRNKRFLLVQRKPEQEFYPWFWSPATGHMREDETQEAAAKRIVKRTFGVDVVSCEPIKTMLSDFHASSLHWWKVDIGDVKVDINLKHAAKHDWMTWSQLIKKDLLPATKSMFVNELKDLILAKGKRRGRFITIDGIDASGKNTQTKLLRKWLEDMGFIVQHVAFPMYERHFGKLVAMYLRGEFGSKEELPTEVSLLYTLDRYHYAPELRKTLKQGEWVIADRYTAANIGFQAGKHKESSDRKRMADWIELVESRMPQPDTVIILKMDPEISQALHSQRSLKSYMFGALKRDIHDEDLEYQKRVMKTFLEASESRPNWQVVDCLDSEGKLRSIDEIQQEIRTIVEMTLFE